MLTGTDRHVKPISKEETPLKRIGLIFVLLLISFFCTIPQALANDLMRVAVVEFDEKGDLDIKDAGAIIADWLITALASDNRFDLKAREVLLKKVLQEQALAQTGIIDQQSAVSIGQVYGVEAIITGTVSKWGKTIKVDARLIDTKTGSVIRVADIEAMDSDDIPKQIKWLAAKISHAQPQGESAANTAKKPVSGDKTKEWDGKLYRLLDLSPYSNSRLKMHGSFAISSQLPEGEVMLGGVPFYIASGVNNIWASARLEGPNPRVLEIPVNVPYPITVYTIMNSEWGKRGGSCAYIEFIGNNGGIYKKELMGDDDIRDWMKGHGWRPAWAQNINGNSTVNVIEIKDSNHEIRLDRQQFNLPEAFHTQELKMIRLVDSGDIYVHRTFIVAVTIVSKPNK